MSESNPLPLFPESPPSASSLWSLSVNAQAIATEISNAAALLESEEEEERAVGVEILEQFLTVEESNNEHILQKADELCRYIDHLKAQAQFQSDHAKRLREQAARYLSKAETMERTLIRYLTTMFPDHKTFDLPLHRIKSTASTRVEIDDPSLLPSEFKRIVEEADKAKIKESFKRDQPVPGAHLESGRSWKIA